MWTDPINPEKFPVNSIIQLKILSKNSKGCLASRRAIGNKMKILENLEENLCEFVEKFTILNIWGIVSIVNGNVREVSAGFERLDQK